MEIGIFDSVPVWGIYMVMALSLLLSFEVGYKISKCDTSSNNKEAFSSITPMVSGLLAMLAFVLAFTFSMASSQHNLRKLSVLEEANAISTAYLRADLIGERDQIKVKQLLKEYVYGRITAVKRGIDHDMFKNAMARTLEIQSELWAQIVSTAKKDPDLNSRLLLQSINSVIDIHQKRVTAGIYNRIPGSIWFVLWIISILTMMTLGHQARLSKSRRLTAVIPLIMAFTALATIVIDLDRPQEGMITVGQEAMIDLKKSLNLKIE